MVAEHPQRSSDRRPGLPPPPGSPGEGDHAVERGGAKGADRPALDDRWDDDGSYGEIPPRGDAIEVPGPPVTIEYEEVRSPPPWLTPMAISIVALLAVFVVTRAAVGNEPEQIRISQTSAGNVPETLADGSPLPELPEAVTSRFEAPVIGTARVADVPESLGDQCARPFSQEQIDGPALQRINDVVDEGVIVDLRMGPEVVSVLRTGTADSPPAWPDTWVLSCLARHEDGEWIARPPRLDFARSGDRGAADSVPGVTARITDVPTDAGWAVQERDGWWLAAPAQPGGWIQLMVSSEQAAEPLRVVFLDEEGNLLEDRTLPPPGGPEAVVGDESDDRRGRGRTLTIGTVDEVLAAVEDGPVRACEDDLQICVWVSLVGSELAAHAASGSHHLDVPPFGELGWCPGADRFQGTVTRSQFAIDGSWRSGIAPRGADAYPLRFVSGEVVVDLDGRMPGDPAGETPRQSVLCVFEESEPIGTVAEDQDAIEPL